MPASRSLRIHGPIWITKEPTPTINPIIEPIKLPLKIKPDIELIKKVTDDRVHEPYRKTLIKEFDIIEKAIKGTNAKLNISGSGPTMLLISKDDIAINLIKKLNLDLDIYNLKVSNGCIIKE